MPHQGNGGSHQPGRMLGGPGKASRAPLRAVAELVPEAGERPGRQVSPSNRRETSSIFEPFPGQRGSEKGVPTGWLGLDRLSISFPIRAFNDSPGAWSTLSISFPGTPEENETRGTKLKLAGGGEAFVGVREVPGARVPLWGKVECNPSRILDPDGFSLAPLDSIEEVASRVVAAAAHELLDPSCGLADMRPRRIDVAKDFTGVTRPASLLAGLATVHRPWSRKNALFNDGTRNGAQTLLVGSKSSGVRLYDKASETDGGVPEGTLRWEVEGRKGWLDRYGGMARLSDITVRTLSEFATDRWEWSGMGTEIGAADEVVERVTRSGLSPAKQQRVLGWLLLVSVGRQASMAKETAAEYRSIARRLGIAIGADCFGEQATAGGAFAARLDWESGREVIRAAA